MSQLSNNLRYLRGLRGWTQNEMAVKACKVKMKAYQAYEEVRATPPPDVMVRICSTFKVSIQQIVTTDLRTGNFKMPLPKEQTEFETDLIQKYKNSTPAIQKAIFHLLEM